MPPKNQSQNQCKHGIFYFIPVKNRGKNAILRVLWCSLSLAPLKSDAKVIFTCFLMGQSESQNDSFLSEAIIGTDTVDNSRILHCVTLTIAY